MSDKIDNDASRNIDLKELKTHFNQKSENNNNDNEIVQGRRSILFTSWMKTPMVKYQKKKCMCASLNQSNPKSTTKTLGVCEP